MPFTPIARFTGHRGAVYALGQADDGTFLSGGGDHQVVRWHLDRPEEGHLLADAGQGVFALHRRAELLFIGDEHGGLHVIDPARAIEVQLEQVHRKGIFAIIALPGERLACAGGDGVLSTWTLQGGAVELERRIPLCEEKLRGLALAAHGQLLAVACGDGAVRLLDVHDLNERHTIPAHEGGATSVAWHPGKPVLLSGGKDGLLRAWNAERAFAPILSFPAHSGSIYAIGFDDQGIRCATASRDKTVKLWGADSLDPLQRLDRTTDGHTHSVNALCWLGDVLLTAGDDRQVIAWADR